MGIGEQLADFAGGRQRVRDLRHRFLADDRRHVGVAARGGKRRSEVGDADHGFVDGIFGLMESGGDLPRCGKSFVQHVSWSLKANRSEEHTSELQSLMRISYAVFCLKK